ncbi:unnamed protein product [Chondrus crispus]|uniref:Uncharacterized protein n=1 Tax=Chondrus crispus TaxID=2769 RepID=R7QE23_CHOCR|nr:unnamed protein product [Chondrus crispus]CDF35978.1 unnamed protein product [Chondrus crispus]|eukprot:XP_005715797.1 unnamed protein product [Chondrus crispus]
MVFRLVYKRGFLPMSVRSFLLNTVAFAGLLSILAFGLRILVPWQGFSLGAAPPSLVSDRSFVVLSVDDFGRWTDSVPLFPTHKFMANHSDLIIRNDYWYRSATVETDQDLRNLENALTRLNFNTSFEQKAVLTPHWIVGGPDFGAMRAAGCDVKPSSRSFDATVADTDGIASLNRPGDLFSNPSEHSDRTTRAFSSSSASAFSTVAAMRGSLDPLLHPTKVSDQFDSCVYKEQFLSDAGPTGLDQAPYHRGDLRERYLSLWKKGLWHPEYHGRSHFSVSKWLKLLRTDSKTQECFKNNLVCATDTTQLRSEFNGFSNKAELKTWLEEGINAFSAFWGYRPALISSPHNTWSSWLTDVAVDLSFVGAELAEDQEDYVQHDPALSMHDRFRFDVFYTGFNCDKAINDIMGLLSVPVEKSLANRWYDFLSAIDLFRKHHPPYHNGIPGNHERFLSLMWHAQNAMSSTYSDEIYSEHMLCMEKAVRTVRESRPRTVFLTGSELHQIRKRGWSQEIWSDSIVLRNYGTKPINLGVPDLRDLYPQSPSWRGGHVLSTVLSAGMEGLSRENSGSPLMQLHGKAFMVGEQLLLPSDTVVKLTRT